MAQQNNTCFGVLEPFDGGDFTEYSERLSAYFIANNIGQVAAGANATAKQAADKTKLFRRNYFGDGEKHIVVIQYIERSLPS